MKHLLKMVTSLGLVIIIMLAFAACRNNKANNQAAIVQITGLSPADREAAFALEAASQRTINIGYEGSLCQAAIAIAQHKGYFEAEGLRTALVKSGGGLENTRDALAGGKIDTAAGMIAGWLVPVTNGIDIRFTVGLHTGCTSAFVLTDSPITKFEKGQTVAISGGFGGVGHNQSYRFIAHDGFAPGDFDWRDFPADQLLLVLQNGQADVAVFGDQLAERWVMDGTLRRIRSLHEDPDFLDEACCVMGIGGPFFDQNPIASEKISRAVYRASKWIEESDENKRETAKILLDNAYITGTEEYAFQMLKLFRFGLSNELTENTLNVSVDEYQALGVIGRNFNANDIKQQIWHPLDIEG